MTLAPPLWGPAPLWMGLEDVDVQKNGHSFVGSGFARVDTLTSGEQIVNVQFYGYTETGLLRDHWTVFHLPAKAGIYAPLHHDQNPETTTPWSSYGTLMSDGDVPEDSYLLDLEKENWVDVIRIDTMIKEISGSFQLHYEMRKDRDKVNPANPSSARFTGSFDISISE